VGIRFWVGRLDLASSFRPPLPLRFNLSGRPIDFSLGSTARVGRPVTVSGAELAQTRQGVDRGRQVIGCVVPRLSLLGHGQAVSYGAEQAGSLGAD